jgi:3'-5' exoribonuclease
MSGDVYRKRVFCSDLRPGDEVDEVFFVAQSERRRGKRGPYLALELVDRSGRLRGNAFDDVETIAVGLVEGRYARVRGRIEEFREETRIRVTGAVSAPGFLDYGEYITEGPVPAEESLRGIRALAESMDDAHLRELVLGCLDDPVFARAFSASPAAMINHHAYVGGLAEHTLSVMELCDRAAVHYSELDRDLLVTGAFCHDIGKVRELETRPGFPYTDEGQLLGHIALGFAMVRDRIARIEGFPEDRSVDLGHLILSHQGELEWGSPVQPRTLEALVLHHLDNLDSKVATARLPLESVESGRTGYVRSLRRSLFRRGRSARVSESVEDPGSSPVPGEILTLFDETDED